MAIKKRSPKRRRRVGIKTSAQLVHKNDKTRVRRMDVGLPSSNGATFRVKIKRK